MTPQRDCDLRVNEDKASSYRRRAREIERLTPQDLHGTIAPQSSPTIFGRAFRKGAVMIDPAFAAVAAAREAHARFEQGLWAENFMVDVSLREAMRELAATIPTTVAGVAAITGFVREKTRELGDSFFQDRDAVAYAESLDTAVRRLTGLRSSN